MPLLTCFSANKSSLPIHIPFLLFLKNLLCLAFLFLRYVPKFFCLKNSLSRSYFFFFCFLILLRLLSFCLLVCFCFHPGVRQASLPSLSLFHFCLFKKIISCWAENSLIFKCCPVPYPCEASLTILSNDGVECRRCS